MLRNDTGVAAGDRPHARATWPCATVRQSSRLHLRATVHESMVTSVQKRMEPRRSLLGASVDQSDARNKLSLAAVAAGRTNDQQNRAGLDEKHRAN